MVASGWSPVVIIIPESSTCLSTTELPVRPGRRDSNDRYQPEQTEQAEDEPEDRATLTGTDTPGYDEHQYPEDKKQTHVSLSVVVTLLNIRQPAGYSRRGTDPPANRGSRDP